MDELARTQTTGPLRPWQGESSFTLVITSCGRLELLERTWQSFWRHADMAPSRTVIVDDSADKDVHEQIQRRYGQDATLIFNTPKVGQLASIDAAYAKVETPWIFHCEDDWEFYRSGFIAASLDILRERPDLGQVHLRELWDLNGGLPSRSIFKTGAGVLYREVGSFVHYFNGEAGEWCGFSLNPALRRTKDYRRVAPFARFDSEHAIDRVLAKTGYRTGVLEQGVCEHIGAAHHVPIFERTRLRWRCRRLVKDLSPPILYRLVRRTFVAKD